jgi:hypothetical protein
MANQFLTRQEVTWESLEILENNCVILPNFYRDLDQEFGKAGGKIGDTIYVRKPPRYIGRDGQAYSPEGITDTQVPVTINQQSGVDFEFSTAEKKLSMDNFRARILEPAMISLGNKLDFRAALIAMQNTANFVGSVGTTPGLNNSDSFFIYTSAMQKLDEMGFPMKGDKRCLAITPLMRTGWMTYAKQWFNPQDWIGKQWKTGQVDNALGMRWFLDQNTPTQVIGTLGGTGVVAGAGQTGSSINTSGWSNNIATLLNVGDIISFGSLSGGAGVYAVNPQNRTSTGSLQQFVVQAPAASNGTGLSTLTILPAIVPSGQFQNVTISPTANMAINVYNVASASQSALSGVSTVQGLLWTKEAYAFVSFPGDVPEGVDMAFEDHSQELGVSLRFARVWDGYRDQWVNRSDVYYGIAPLYMEGGVRIAGS